MKINRFGEYVVCKTFFIVLIAFHSTNNLISLFYTPIRANNSPYPRPVFAHNVYNRQFMIKNALGKRDICRAHNPFYGTVITSTLDKHVSFTATVYCKTTGKFIFVFISLFDFCRYRPLLQRKSCLPPQQNLWDLLFQAESRLWKRRCIRVRASINLRLDRPP